MSDTAVRAWKFQVVDFGPNRKEVAARWKHLAEQCQRVTNAAWRQWIVEHTKQDAPNKLRQFYEELRQWHDAGGKKSGQPKPESGVKCMTPAISKAIYTAACQTAEDMNLRPVTLLLQLVKQNMTKRKSASGNQPGWCNILLDRESMPSCTRPQPIPFDKRNAELLKDGDTWKMSMRIDRIPRDGKPALSTRDTVTITAGKKRSGYAILERVYSGEYDFCGSTLQFDRGKWYVSLCFRRPQRERVELDAEATAHLLPCRTEAFRLWVPGGDFYRPIGDGRFVGPQRRNLIRQRTSRNAHYTHAGSSMKGHGRDRARAGHKKLQRRWLHLNRTTNHTLTKRVVQTCERLGIGKLVYYQPTGKAAATRYMEAEGKLPNVRDATGWQWFQVGTMLAQKCQESGVELEIVKC